MGTKAYFMINVGNRPGQQDGYYLEAWRDLEAIPEVKSIEALSGAYDFMVEVDAPQRVIFVADKILAKPWVKRLHVLKVEPVEPPSPPKRSLRDIFRDWRQAPPSS